MSVAGALAARRPGAKPSYLDRRFDARGRALPCAGSTVIAHVDDATRAAMTVARDAMAGADFADCWAWLPPSSYHMTYFDLLLHDRRGPGFWPDDLALDADGAAADRHVIARMRGFDVGGAAPFRMRVVGVNAWGDAGIGVQLAPDGAAEDARLRGMRDRMAARLGLAARPGHAAYVFHATLAYLIDWPGVRAAGEADLALAAASEALRAAQPVFTLGAPELCLFDDMTEFRVQMVL